MSKRLKEILSAYKDKLKNISDTAQLDVSIIVEFVTGISKAKQIADSDMLLTDEQIDKIDALINRRINFEPIAYIINSKGFWKYDFYVDSRVLIPRPETEIIVENGLKFLTQLISSGSKSISILDLGCGSGCIGLSILKDLIDSDLPSDINIELSLVDKSLSALEVSKINSKLLSLDQLQNNIRVNFIHSDWFSSVTGKFDLIVCNPPYIAKDDKRVYAGAVFEPSQALYSEDSGHADIKHLLLNIRKFLKDNSLALIELGIDSADLFREQVDGVLNDASGIGRVLKLALN